MFFFFFSSRRRHTRSLCDWSSDVCSSDLELRARLVRVHSEWRAVLSEAFARARDELGLDVPLEALVSLVYTFNEGIMLDRLSGIEAEHRVLLEWIDSWLERRLP